MRIMEAIKQFIKGMVANQMPAVVAAANTRLAAPIDLSGLDRPGPSAKKPAEIILPVVVEPTPVAATEVPASVATCPHCGQSLPERISTPATVAAVVEPVGDVPSILTADWNNSENNTLPPRTQPQIASLLAAGETEKDRERRIVSDKLRYAHMMGR